MKQQNAIQLFEEKQVRTLWDEEQEKWYFSIIDVIEVLTGSPRSRKYWNALKTKLQAEGSELSHNLGQLKMQSTDGKFYTKDISLAVNPKTFEQSKTVAQQGGNVAKVALKELEAKTGKKVVTAHNAKSILPENKTAKKLKK